MENISHEVHASPEHSNRSQVMFRKDATEIEKRAVLKTAMLEGFSSIVDFATMPALSMGDTVSHDLIIVTLEKTPIEHNDDIEDILTLSLQKIEAIGKAQVQAATQLKSDIRESVAQYILNLTKADVPQESILRILNNLSGSMMDEIVRSLD